MARALVNFSKALNAQYSMAAAPSMAAVSSRRNCKYSFVIYSCCIVETGDAHNYFGSTYWRRYAGESVVKIIFMCSSVAVAHRTHFIRIVHAGRSSETLIYMSGDIFIILRIRVCTSATI